ncbi:hypothetical protein B5E60_08420 [Alistipes sp. An116]|uniref:FecR family protein n=1 Tax=Alistipes sp. An116 TaxID=1965546 RepID=UPI000B36E71D|nr:FecR domain-containing protein [Alistipes sp. An116]OUQ53198.1 hypothetical protein B5E60_08420 [Alistipes sp. An116]
MNNRKMDEKILKSQNKKVNEHTVDDAHNDDFTTQEAERIIRRTTIEFGPKDQDQLSRIQEETWAEIRTRLSDQGRTISLRRRIVRTTAAAAAILAAGIMTLLLLERPVEMIVVENMDSGIRELMLEDSTHVWLRNGAKLSYPKKFAKNERPVTLTGEAFFDVARDTSRPFTVNTSAVEIKVLGTRFNVQTEQNGNITEVALESGSVALHMPGADVADVKIKPGELAVANQHDLSISVSEADPYLSSAWKEKVLTFRARPLDYILQTLANAYGIEIRLGNENLGKTSYTGKFKRSLPLEEVLTIIGMSIPIEYEFNADGSIDIR